MNKTVMAASRKFCNFRQLSLSCETPSSRQKRQTLKKQYSEDIPDLKNSFFDRAPEIQISLNVKNKKIERNNGPPIKIAWEDRNESVPLNEEVIIKKCGKEIKRASSGKLTRHLSLEKDSILNSKQDLAERLRVKNDEKPNLKIVLTQDSRLDNIENNSAQQLEKSQPKYLKPLGGGGGENNAFQIKKSVNKKPLDSPNQKRPNFSRSNTIVVVPLVEKEAPKQAEEDAKPAINVIIRPMTAQSKREKFQKRTNSAFHNNPRPPLVRSSSAPSTRPEKSKFLATKRKVVKHNKNVNVEAKEWNNAAAPNGSEIVTMVSLISPSGSENDDASEDDDDDGKERPKSVLKRESSVAERIQNKEDDISKTVTLRKTVKSVSFQQSSIHAVRSFSASFPARRGSMASALSLGMNRGNSQKANIAKVQEKRGTNPGSPDADASVPKRRLVRSNTGGEAKADSSWQKAATQIGRIMKAGEHEEEIGNSTFTIDIQAKSLEPSTMKLDLEENVILLPTTDENETDQKEEPPYNTPKEKQCWAMYCKITAKGINVSYDTILRGMLTPTEYRIRRKPSSVAEEMKRLMNPALENTKAPPSMLPTERHIGPQATAE